MLVLLNSSYLFGQAPGVVRKGVPELLAAVLAPKIEPQEGACHQVDQTTARCHAVSGTAAVGMQVKRGGVSGNRSRVEPDEQAFDGKGIL
jgi:hypothetical protein